MLRKSILKIYYTTYKNKKQENQNIEFPKVSEVPTNPFTEEEQQLYQQK